MTPAFRLLAACCRWPDDDRRAEAVQAAATGFTEWDSFALLAERHRVEPLVVHGLSAARIPVPPQIAAAAESARADALRDLGETLRIAAALDAGVITHRFLKGIPLGIAAYGTPTLKRSWDIDLLVLPQEAVAAAAILGALGYRPSMPPRPFNQVEYDRWSVVSKEAEFRSPRGTTVELHWRVSDHPHLLRTIDAATPAKTIPLLGERSVAMLADGANLVYLAVHGAAHGWFRLKWIADFNALLATAGLDVEEQLQAARRFGGGRALDCAIELSRMLFDETPVHLDGARHRLTKLAIAALTATTERESAVVASRARWQLAAGMAYRRAEFAVRLRGTLDRIDYPLPPRWLPLYPWLRIPFWLHRQISRRWRKERG